jgi:6-pyruvoyltetrahydropterin/6-carboxytetrahydropterin synthase
VFEVGVAQTFHALHHLEPVEQAGAGPEQHDHDYRVEAVVRGESLGETGMLLDLDLLGAALATCLGELDASDLDTFPAFAGRDTTVEVVAGHVWEHLREQVGEAAALESLRVTVYESASAWASVDRPLER